MSALLLGATRLVGARLGQLPDTGYVRAAAFSLDGRNLLAGYNERFAARRTCWM
jgi:hypothetical protein